MAAPEYKDAYPPYLINREPDEDKWRKANKYLRYLQDGCLYCPCKYIDCLTFYDKWSGLNTNEDTMLDAYDMIATSIRLGFHRYTVACYGCVMDDREMLEKKHLRRTKRHRPSFGKEGYDREML